MTNIIGLPEQFSSTQKEFIDGSLLGDACVYRGENKYNPVFKILRQTKDIDYLKWQFEFMKDFCSTEIHNNKYFDKRTNKYYYRSYFFTRNLKLLNEVRDRWYVNRKKIVPKDLVLTPLTLAIWFCDDGCITTPNLPYRFELKLATQAFTKEEVEFLASSLEDLLDEKFMIHRDNSCFLLKGNDNATRAFLSKIDGYISGFMDRKANIWRADSARYYNNIPNRVIALLKNRENDLTLKEMIILNYLYHQNNNITIRQMIQNVNISKHDFPRYLKRFLEIGLINRFPNPLRKGGFVMSITSKGRLLLEHMKEKVKLDE
jgi:DNA-binding MarR family transcriptional regulator